MAMTPGANKSKQLAIYKLMQQGFDAGQISRQVKVYKDCVERWMEHFKNAKALPQTSAFAEIKEGMPRIPGHGRVSGLMTALENSQASNAELVRRINEMDAEILKLKAGSGPKRVKDDDSK